MIGVLFTVGPVAVIAARYGVVFDEMTLVLSDGQTRPAYWCMGDCRCMFIPDIAASTVYMDRLTMLTSYEPRNTCAEDNGHCDCHDIPGEINFSYHRTQAA